MADLRAMGATNVLVERSRKPTVRAIFARTAEILAERFSDADGRIRATFEIIWLSGWARTRASRSPSDRAAPRRGSPMLGVREGTPSGSGPAER